MSVRTAAACARQKQRPTLRTRSRATAASTLRASRATRESLAQHYDNLLGAEPLPSGHRRLLCSGSTLSINPVQSEPVTSRSPHQNQTATVMLEVPHLDLNNIEVNPLEHIRLP